MIEIRIIDEEHKQDINLKNEEFLQWGRMVPAYTEGKWSYKICEFAPEDAETECFPDENYSYEKMRGDHVFIGAYDGSGCVGLAIMRDAFLKQMYLYDLKVNRAYRKQGVGRLLIQKAKEVAAARGYCGIYTQGQDNNPSACLFYLHAGFRIGGLDTEVYKGTSQEGKADILFYLDI